VQPGDTVIAVSEEPTEPEPREIFYPDSLCHDCAAPPKFIRNRRGSIFLFCPLFKRYPPQPVRACEKFVPKDAPPPGPA
jgi:hypothetical protein